MYPLGVFAVRSMCIAIVTTIRHLSLKACNTRSKMFSLCNSNKADRLLAHPRLSTASCSRTSFFNVVFKAVKTIDMVVPWYCGYYWMRRLESDSWNVTHVQLPLNSQTCCCQTCWSQTCWSQTCFSQNCCSLLSNLLLSNLLLSDSLLPNMPPAVLVGGTPECYRHEGGSRVCAPHGASSHQYFCISVCACHPCILLAFYLYETLFQCVCLTSCPELQTSTSNFDFHFIFKSQTSNFKLHFQISDLKSNFNSQLSKSQASDFIFIFVPMFMLCQDSKIYA